MLQYLREKDDFVKIRELATEYKVTERAIRYNLDKIEKFLIGNGYDYLDKQHAKGVRLKKQDGLNEFIDKFINTKTPYKYVYSKVERKNIMIAKLLQSENHLKVDYFEKLLYVSRNTILKELDSIELWLKDRGLYLMRKPKLGIFVQGRERDKRKAIVEIAFETISSEDILSYIAQKIVKNKMNKFQFDILFSDIDVSFLNSVIIYAERILNKEFNDETYSNLLTHLAIMIKRIQFNKHIYIKDIEKDKIKNSQEYKVSIEIIKRIEKKFEIIVPEVEVYYISLHLFGAKSLKMDEILKDDLYKIAETMTKEIAEKYNVKFENESKIIEGLVIHLRPTIYRLKFGFKLDNPLLNEIIINYRDLFFNTKFVVRHLEEYINSKISDDEIAYITLHFGAALENISEKNKRKTKIVVVCGTGIGTAKMVASRLTKEFNVEVVNTISSRLIHQIKKQDYDVIVSTVDIPKYHKKYIKINAVLLKKDYDKLKKYLDYKYKPKNNTDDILVDRLMKVIGKYSDINDRQQLEYELMHELKMNQEKIFIERKIYMLNDLLKRNTIKLNIESENRTDAILEGTSVLIEKGNIDPTYEQAILNNFKEMGPYMVVAPGIVLAHARPEDGVNEICMSLVTLKNPIKFGHEDNDPVKLIITFAAKDNTSHLKALSQLMELFMNTKDIQTIMETTKKDEVLSVIKKYSTI